MTGVAPVAQGGHSFVQAGIRTDRQRIERALPARLAWYVANRLASPESGTGEETSPTMPSIVGRFARSVDAGLGIGLGDEAKAKLARRLDRALGVVFSDLNGRPTATALVGLRHLLNGMILAGVWEPDDPDAFWSSWSDLSDAVYEGDGADLLDEVDRSASRWAARASRRIRMMGLYGGYADTSWPEAS
jgi:hypothetical protein